jgi:hypothetical protein
MSAHGDPFLSLDATGKDVLEKNYIVCRRCRMSAGESVGALADVRIVRSPRGEFVVRAVQPETCRVCGGTEVEVLYGNPIREVRPWRARDRERSADDGTSGAHARHRLILA